MIVHIRSTAKDIALDFFFKKLFENKYDLLEGVDKDLKKMSSLI
ncbi:MAG: hypothetical protein QG670_301 [Thermoproteota archaeon]|nr:hypothetical protein [Thermoproteota archaeon]